MIAYSIVQSALTLTQTAAVDAAFPLRSRSGTTDNFVTSAERKATPMNLADLQREAHAIAKDHGWWDEDKPRSFGDLIALVHSELSEALEAYRKEVPTFGYGYFVDPDGRPFGVASELADVVIRVADMAEWYHWSLNSDGGAPTQTSFGDWIAHVHYHLSQAYGEPQHQEQYLNNVVVGVYCMATHYGIDLDAAIEAKMEYNRTRSYRHGGRAL